MGVLEAIFAFLVEHADIISLIKTAIEAGVSKDSLAKAIQAEMVAASDAEMKRELG